jgi:prepilin-type N-terminal cleavage/methylation domain-containing protein
MLRYVVLNHIFNRNFNNNYKNKPDNNEGFTLTEMLVTAIVVGVLAAVTIPNFLGLMSKNQVQESADTIATALRDIQKEAMAKSINCELRVDGTNRTIAAFSFTATYVGSTETISYPSTVSGNCLTSSYSLRNNINLITNGTPTSQIKIRYSYKGNATSETTNTDAVIVVSSTSSPEKKCVIVPDGIGIIRTGIYSSTSANSAEPSSCSTSN